MAPHADESNGNKDNVPTTTTLNPGISPVRAKNMHFPKQPTFDDKYKERDYLKGKLAAAFRIFGKYGFDEGVAGHITLRVQINRVEELHDSPF